MEGEQSLPQSTATRQHYVPAFSLAQFAQPVSRKGWLQQLDVQSGKPDRTRPEDAAFRPDLYTYEDSQGEMSRSVEAFFSIIEKHAAPALACLRESPADLTPQDRDTIAYFLVLQESRTPAGLTRSERLRQAAMEIQAGMDLASTSRFREAFKSEVVDSLSLEELEEMRGRMQRQLLEGRVGYASPRTGALSQIIKGAGELAKDVYSLDWTVLTAEGAEFITSDRPVSMVDLTPEYPWSGNAWNSSSGAISFYPLSPTVGLFMTPGDCGFSLATSTPEQIRRLNLMTYGWAEQFIYGTTQEVVTEVRGQARRHPTEVAKRKSLKHVLLVPADRLDPSVAAEYERQGWPRRIPGEGPDGKLQLMGYVVIDLDEPAGTAARAAMQVAEGLSTTGS